MLFREVVHKKITSDKTPKIYIIRRHSMKTLGELIWDENPMEIDNTSPPLDPNGIQIECIMICCIVVCGGSGPICTFPGTNCK